PSGRLAMTKRPGGSQMRISSSTRFGRLAAAAIACAGIAGLGAFAPAPAAAQEGVTSHWAPAEGAGILRIDGDEYQVPLDGSLRLSLAGVLMDRVYRSWYHGDALVVRVYQEAPEVALP